ncbi:uncharacterized protein EV420DRAFT_1742806 [Desarmillaria tabescens]|uniref:Uncharacterized protein n=1 Tax=Armillaria tabescens TaxID=1929756 RepID=A0AA39NRG5_ARMTA|nr:uncharacterized protein EV420DRAFT_1742806 [Desarmillaria tabescens]KAK0470478.1 hypothetical protein EV420DRAFT_1742806 [Desarmillaria tabescens]
MPEGTVNFAFIRCVSAFAAFAFNPHVFALNCMRWKKCVDAFDACACGLTSNKASTLECIRITGILGKSEERIDKGVREVLTFVDIEQPGPDFDEDERQKWLRVREEEENVDKKLTLNLSVRVVLTLKNAKTHHKNAKLSRPDARLVAFLENPLSKREIINGHFKSIVCESESDGLSYFFSSRVMCLDVVDDMKNDSRVR